MRFHRYIFGQVLAGTVLAVALFAFLLLAGNAFREFADLIQTGRLEWPTALYLLGVLVPTVLPYALPMGLLFATLLALGRLSAGNEITALKAGGISLWQIAAPVWLLGLLGALVNLAIMGWYEPLAKTELRQTLANVLRGNPARLIQPGTFLTEFPGLVMYVEQREGARLQGLYLWELDDRDRVVNFVRGDRATFTYDRAGDALVLTIRGGHGERRDPEAPEDFLRPTPVASATGLQLRLPLEAIVKTPQRKLAYLTIPELIQRRATALESAPREPSAPEPEVMPLQFLVHKRLAFGFGVLSLCLFAVPLAVKTGRAETHANLGLAVALGLGFFMLTAAVSWLEPYPHLRPDLLIWLPNLLFQSGGLLLTARAARH